ncbi:MAG: glycosyltransferase family 1 protein [Verrucomicrobiota bacterium]
MSDRPLRIEVVTDTYVPDINGVSFSLGHLCTGLRARGHQVEIIRSGRSHSEHESTVFSWPLPGYWEIKVGAPWPGELLARWRKHRPDVIYVAIETPLGFSAVAAARKLGIPLVGGFHTNFREYLQNYGVDWIGRQVWRYQKWFHSRLDRTLVPSPDAREKLANAGFSQVSVLGRGVDTELFNPRRRSAELRRSYGAVGDSPVALVVGRVSTEKNICLAIRAFQRMRQACPEMVCMVVGDGPARAKLMRAHPDVLFPGYLTGERLAACYASCDIMLFPSETETFGNVLIEGMSSGLAVLGYDYAAAGWHGRDGENLLKVPLGDEDEFIESSARLLESSLRETLGRGARATAESLAWPAIIDELESVLHEVIDR